MDLIKWRQIAIELKIDPQHIHRFRHGEDTLTEKQISDIQEYLSKEIEVINNFLKEAKLAVIGIK